MKLNCIKFVIISFLLGFRALDAAPPSLPPGAIEQIDPGRTGEMLTPPETRPDEFEPGEIQVLDDDSKVKLKAGDGKKFIFRGFIIEGNTIFTSEQLAKIYSKYVNQEISFSQLKQIVKEITVFYRNHGYILTKVIIPPQEIDEWGTVKIIIMEGRIEKISVEGNLRPAMLNLLNSYGKNIANSGPLKLQNIERYILLANDLPGTHVRAILSPSENSVGAADLTLVAMQQRNNWYVGANNYSSEVLGRGQMMAGINANGYFSGSQTGLRGVLGFHFNRLKYAAFAHKQQLNTRGLGIDFNISSTTTNPEFESLGLAYLNTPGQALNINLATNYAYIRSRKKNLYLYTGFNYINSQTTYYGVKLFDDALRSVYIKFSGNTVSKDGSLNEADLAYEQGLNILSARAAPPSIVGGKTNFGKISGGMTRYQKLYKQELQLLLWLKWQYSFTQELSAEKFGFGGAPFGYGYDPSVITGDHGYEFKFEPQFVYTLNNKVIPRIQFFGFLDTASVWNINKSVQAGHQSATSIGLGSRFAAYNNFSVELIVAHPFNIFATNNNSNRTRLLFNINYSGGTIFG